MKKTIAKIAAVLLVVCMLFSFASCGKKLEGTYTSSGLLSSSSVTFSGDNAITFSFLGVEGSGTYVIEDGVIKITYTSLLGSQVLEKSFAQDGDTVTIDGTVYTKAAQ